MVNKINQEKINEATKEYQRILEDAKKEIKAQQNKLGFVDKKQTNIKKRIAKAEEKENRPKMKIPLVPKVALIKKSTQKKIMTTEERIM